MVVTMSGFSAIYAQPLFSVQIGLDELVKLKLVIFNLLNP